jgi:hypothetical protein
LFGGSFLLGRRLLFFVASPPPPPRLAPRAPTTTNTIKMVMQPRRMRPPVPRGCCARGRSAASCVVGAVPPLGWGGGGTSTSASGVGTCAVSWTALPHPGQKRSSCLNSCPQFLQYLSATIVSRYIRPLMSGVRARTSGKLPRCALGGVAYLVKSLHLPLPSNRCHVRHGTNVRHGTRRGSRQPELASPEPGS